MKAAIYSLMHLPQRRRGLAKNFISMMVLYGGNYLVPLMVLPYILRTLGPTQYGVVVYSQAICQYFVIVVDYGFSLNATKEISVNRRVPATVSEIYTAVMLIKFLILILSALCLFLLSWGFPSFVHEPLMVFAAFGLVIGSALFPTWLFQGMEQMSYITIINLIGRTMYAVSIFVFVKDSAQAILVVSLNSSSSVLVGLVGTIVAISKYGIVLRVRLDWIKVLLRDGFFFLLSRLSVTLYTVSNSIILGDTVGVAYAGYYGLAEKLVNLAKTPFELLNTVVYPNVSFSRDVSFIKKILVISLAVGFFVCVFVFVFAGNIVHLISGDGFSKSVALLRLFTLGIPLASVHYFLGSTTLVALGRAKFYNYSVMFSVLIYLLVVPGLVLSHHVGLLSLGITVLLVEVGLLLFRVVVVVRLKLLKN